MYDRIIDIQITGIPPQLQKETFISRVNIATRNKIHELNLRSHNVTLSFFESQAGIASCFDILIILYVSRSISGTSQINLATEVARLIRDELPKKFQRRAVKARVVETTTDIIIGV